MQILIEINGTGINPYEKFGLTQNPFPKLGKAEWYAGEMAINSLAGPPVKSEDDIRNRLAGKVTQELIDLCVAQFKPGEVVSFKIEWKE